jgi:hypothetical protein
MAIVQRIVLVHRSMSILIACTMRGSLQWTQSWRNRVIDTVADRLQGRQISEDGGKVLVGHIAER